MKRSAQLAIDMADKLVRLHSVRSGEELAQAVGIEVLPLNFSQQKGVYTVLERNRFIFIKDDLEPIMRSIVLLHEVGHDALHREEAVRTGGFQEFNIYDTGNSRMEYEANLFAAQVSLPDEEILDYIYGGYDVQQIAQAMYSDINLVALKVSYLRQMGHDLREQEWRNGWLG